jgi:4-hydroxybenzoate polyprenyltransferase
MEAMHAGKRLLLVSRPGIWLPVMAIYIAGVVHGGVQWSWIVVLGALFTTAPFGLILYGINDITDREADALSKRKEKGIMGVRVRERDVPLFIWSGVITALAFLAVFLFTRHYASAIAVVVLCFVAVSYSVPPLRFKVRPMFDALDHVIAAIAVYAMGFLADVTGVPTQWPTTRTLFILTACTVAVYGIAALIDYDTDKKVGDTTLAVLLGQRPTMWLAAVLFAACAAAAWASHAIAGFFLCAAVVSVVAALIPVQRLPIILRSMMIIGLVGIPLLAVYLLATR